MSSPYFVFDILNQATIEQPNQSDPNLILVDQNSEEVAKRLLEGQQPHVVQDRFISEGKRQQTIDWVLYKKTPAAFNPQEVQEKVQIAKQWVSNFTHSFFNKVWKNTSSGGGGCSGCAGCIQPNRTVLGPHMDSQLEDIAADVADGAVLDISEEVHDTQMLEVEDTKQATCEEVCHEEPSCTTECESCMTSCHIPACESDCLENAQNK